MTTFIFLYFFALVVLVILTGGCRVAVGAVKPGVGAGAYRNTGTYAVPVWTELTLVKDVQLNLPWDMVEAGSRETRAKLYAKTRVDVAPQLVVRADDLDAGYNALADAAVSPTSKPDLMILDGDITVVGVRGVRAEFNVSLTGQPQEIDGVIYDTFECKPAWSSDGYPSSVVMGASSAPTFTAF